MEAMEARQKPYTCISGTIYVEKKLEEEEEKKGGSLELRGEGYLLVVNVAIWPRLSWNNVNHAHMKKKKGKKQY